MQTHRLRVVIPEDHRLVVEVPKDIRSGPAELIFFVPPETSTEVRPTQVQTEALARWDAVAAELSADRRPFHCLTRQEKLERHRLLRGIGKGLLPSSDEVASSKREEVGLEEAKLDRS